MPQSSAPSMVTLRALNLGDLLVSIPALCALRRALPEHSHVLAAPDSLRDVVALIGGVDRLVPTNGLGRLTGVPHAPDVAVNLHGAGPQSTKLLERLEPSRRIGFGGTGWPGPQWPHRVHERERWCHLLQAHGVAADPEDLAIDRPQVPSPAPGSVVIHPGAAYGSRRWPLSRFADVARRLSELGQDVVFSGGAADHDRAHNVAAAAGLPPESVLAGRTSLAELAALIAEARLIVSGDTGVAHLSYAYRTPSVVLFGPVPAAWWGPPTAGPHVALSNDAIRRGERFAETPDPALLGLGSDTVVAAARSLL